MRHRKKFNHLGRKKGHRMSMLANMSSSLIIHKRINTTLPKAKALKMFIEPLITKSKSDTTHNRRIVFSKIKQKKAISELFRNIAVKVGDRPGGYTRIIRLGNRLGDNAEMAMIELVDYNEIYVPTKKKTTRRSRRGNKKDKRTDIKDNKKPKNDILESTNDEDKLVKDTPVEDTPVEDTPAEEAPVEDTPVEDTPAEEAPVEDTPAEETPAEEATVEDTPVEETPAEEATVEDTSVKETPAEETPDEETPVDEAPSETDKKEKK